MNLQCTYEINPNCADVAVQIWIILITEGKLSETLTLSFKDDDLIQVNYGPAKRYIETWTGPLHDLKTYSNQWFSAAVVTCKVKSHGACFFKCTFIILQQLHWPRSLRWKNKPKHYSGWFVVREKHYSGWKNKLKSTDYKTSEQGH